MSEESATPESVDPAGVSLALAGASRAKADAYLDDQRHHLHEQLKQLHLDVWEKRMGVVLRVATAIVGIAVATAFAVMIWDASQSKGLVITPFAVPQDMAQQGLTGQVVAAQLLDKLSVLGASESSRATQSYANNWGDNIKVEIPETGISVQELYSFLRQWLGHDIAITGEVYHTASGIAVTARAGDKGATFTGAENELDGLVQKAAEHVFEVTQPYRYGNYLDRNYAPAGLQDRVTRAAAIYRKLIAGDDPVERAWAWNGLGTIEFNFNGNERESAADYLKAIASTPDFTIGYFALAARYIALDDKEKELAGYQTAAKLLHRPSVPDLDPAYMINARTYADMLLADLTAEYAKGIPIAEAGAQLPNSYSVLGRGNFWAEAALFMVRLHDPATAKAYLHSLGVRRIGNGAFRLQYEALMGDWAALADEESGLRKLVTQSHGVYRDGALYADDYSMSRQYFALGKAEQGDLGGAEAMIAPTAGDCDSCLRIRGQIAALRGQPARADYWFARAVANAPSLTFAYTDWGQALLARGEPDKAIAQFAIASRKAPHFADPVEMWGEALMAKNRSDQALAKFEEAEQYARRWGRLHLKWGEALIYAGKADQANKQFALAAGLDLDAADKAELERMTAARD